MAPQGWSNAARRRRGHTDELSGLPCWGCGVIDCLDCGPDPDHSEDRRSYTVADDDPDDVER